MLTRAVLAVALTATVSLANAAEVCSAGFVTGVAATLGHKGTAKQMRDCRVLPSMPDQVAVILATPLAAPKGTPAKWDMDLAIVKTDGTLVQHLRRPGGLDGGGHQLVSVQLDTGRYNLAPDVRALGLRVRHKTPPAAWDYVPDTTILELFVADGKTLRSVLRGLVVASVKSDDDVIDCSEVKFETGRVLDLAPSSTKGMRDLLIKTKHVSTTPNRKSDELCEAFDGKPRLENMVVRYNGSTYALPDELRSTCIGPPYPHCASH